VLGEANNERRDNFVRMTNADGQTFGGELFRPPEGPAPAVLLIPEMYGINGYLREIAARYVAHGFLVLAIDVLWRIEHRLVLSYTGPDNATAHAYHDRFDFAEGTSDMRAAIALLRRDPQSNGRVGAVGFCLGGTMAYLAAARCGADAASAYYGSRIVEFLAEAAAIRVPLELQLGALDKTIPPDAQAQLGAATAGNPAITTYIYGGAQHAFANHLRPDRYHAQAAAAAEARTLALFDRVLRP
jgi:carboxymethylenebutenolidase